MSAVPTSRRRGCHLAAERYADAKESLTSSFRRNSTIILPSNSLRGRLSLIHRPPPFPFPVTGVSNSSPSSFGVDTCAADGNNGKEIGSGPVSSSAPSSALTTVPSDGARLSSGSDGAGRDRGVEGSVESRRGGMAEGRVLGLTLLPLARPVDLRPVFGVLSAVLASGVEVIGRVAMTKRG